MDIPLIWTTKGNIPVDSLVVTTSFEDFGNTAVFVEIHTLDGEEVKRNTHLIVKKGLSLFGEKGAL